MARLVVCGRAELISRNAIILQTSQYTFAKSRVLASKNVIKKKKLICKRGKGKRKKKGGSGREIKMKNEKLITLRNFLTNEKRNWLLRR